MRLIPLCYVSFNILGLLSKNSNDDDKSTSTVDESAIESLLSQRLLHKQNGDYDQADDIRDQLTMRGITVWDKERIWTTNPDSRGGSARHRNGGRYNTSNAQRRGASGGHDYTQVQDTIIDTSICQLTLDEINELIAQRLQFKKQRDFEASDALQRQLSEEHGIDINDRDKVWRADGVGFQRRGDDTERDENRGSGIANRRASGVGHDYTQVEDTIIDTSICELTIDQINEGIAQRLQFKKQRDFEASDALQKRLSEEHGICIHDKDKVWRADGVGFGSVYDVAGRGIYGRGEDRRDVDRRLGREGVSPSNPPATATFTAASTPLTPPPQVEDPLREYDYVETSSTPFSTDELTSITEQIQARSLALQDSNVEIADLIRTNLLSKYSVVLHDKNRQWFRAGKNVYAFNATGSDALPEVNGDGGVLFTEKVVNLIQKRTLAREVRDYEKADAVKGRLMTKYGVRVKDIEKEWTFSVDLLGSAPVEPKVTPAKVTADVTAKPVSLDTPDLPGTIEEQSSSPTDDVSTLTVVQLKERLRAAGLPVSGAKSVLIERLLTME
uniref:SAP domain-containing protein n=1 Tax=Proboscia inermis TaxID=420281 RepID=A0A7S0C5V8_9STRA